jgi:uncharacterized phage-associated protein
MEEVPVYEDSLTKVVVEFMANPRMLGPVIQIVYGKTSAHNYQAVQKTMDMSAQWFASVLQNNCLIP